MTVTTYAASEAAPAPVAPKIPKDVSVHGDKRIDDYFWLRDLKNPAVLDYLKAENAHTEAVTAPTKPLQETLYRELLGRIKQTDLSVPYHKKGYWYYTRTEEGKQYPVYCRKPGSLEGAEEIMLDVNVLAVGEKFMEIGDLDVSDDGRLLAYSVDRNGHRDYEVFVKDLRTGALLPQKIGTASSLEWAADNDTLFYTQEEPVSKRSCRLLRWALGTGKHKLLYTEKDEQYDLDLGRSLDGKYLFCSSESKETTEVRALPADHPTGKFRVILPREENHEYHVDHRDGLFYIVTNKGSKNFRIVTAPVATPDPKHWTEFVPHNPAVKIEGIELFARHAVVEERENGLPFLRVIDFKSGESHRLEAAEPAYEMSVEVNEDYDTDTLRYRYESLVTPPTVYAYDVVTRRRTQLKQTEIVGGYDASRYVSERLFATADDGTRIPISLVYRRDLRRTEPQPLLLYGYGSYGFSLPDSFSSNRLSLLDRGLIYAVAHVRGGGELGEEWHDHGKMKEKMNTFTDFIACAQYLIRQGYTTPPDLLASGGSAGGLLMGAVVNLRPDLWHAVIYDVPFVDVLNTMLDPTLPLTTAEYLEWGNPTVKEEYAWMRAYSPYDNIAAQPYPAILVNVSLHDSQVPYWEGTKLVAKLRALKTDQNVLLLKANLDAGHGGASGRYDSLKETAFDYAWLLSTLHIDK
ncbi:MAG: S9 family peptidase [Verrucomicrobia bacterium]|nr:S9 family peptidase [Verrucomicrobiota bacterium]